MIEGKDDIGFSSLLPQPCLRKTAAKRFSQLLGNKSHCTIFSYMSLNLALATKQVLQVRQDIPYGDITISRGPEF